MRDYWGFAGKTCVVTGARTGVGRATAEMLVDMGAKVYAMGRHMGEIPGMEGFILVDLCDKASIDHAFTQLPEQIDYFFGCAGAFGDTNDFMTVTKTNYLSNKYMIEQYLSTRMVDGGAIGFVTSNNGRRWEEPEKMDAYLPTIQAEGWDGTIAQLVESGLAENSGMAAYDFSKRCMNYYAALAAYELGKRHIRVNCVLPGPIHTKMLQSAMDNMGYTPEQLANEILVNAGRIAEPEEIAGPLLALSSNLASFVSGAHVFADYGLDAYITIGKKEDIIHGAEQPLQRNDQ